MAVAPSVEEGKGIISFPFGAFWMKGLHMRGGMAPIRDVQELLLTMINSGKANPSFIFDTEFDIKDAEEAYRQFDKMEFIKAAFRF